jgi:hypothetical protein
MGDATVLIDQAPLQDRDLLQRLSLYFDGIDARLRQGQGWFIFNAVPGRSNRIAEFIRARLQEVRTSVSSTMVPWRDFALSAYVQEIGLRELAPAAETGRDPILKHEYDLASRVTKDTWDRFLFSDVLVLVGLKPEHAYEAMFLDRAIDSRYQKRLATILLTPEMPDGLAAEFASVDPSRTYWDRLFQRMYETSLVAL